MSNVLAPQGFMPVGNESGSAPTFAQATGWILADYETAIYIGDVVVFASGYLNLATAGTTTIAGVFVGCQYTSPNAGKPIFGYWPGSGAVSGSLIQAFFINDPFAEFYAQSNGAAITQADVDQNINFVAGTGNALSGRSGEALDASSLGSQADTQPFRVVSVGGPTGFNGSDNTSSYNWVKVVFNNQMLRNLTSV